MKALVYGDKMPALIDCSIAYHGLEELEADITLLKSWYSLSKEDFEQYDVCVGSVTDCRFALTRMGLRDFDIDCYPSELTSFLGRDIQTILIQDILKIKDTKFVKPVKPKRFAAFTTDEEDYYMRLMNTDDDEKIYVSDIMHFQSEWRVYIHDNKIEAICNYKGDPTLFPNVSNVYAMIHSWKGPKCYVLDIGVSDGMTLLVEFNDFYSIGNYGLFPEKYVEMLIARWNEFKLAIK